MDIEKFKAISPDLLENESMAKHTTFHVGGNADMYVSVKSVRELSSLIKLTRETDTPFTIIGNGSNILVKDKGIRGLVIEIGSGMSDFELKGNKIYAQAGVLISKLASLALNHSLSGMEEISGIPGTLGGGIYMNAGAYGGELKNIIKTVTYIDEYGEEKTVTADECGFGYRKSIFTNGGKYIVSAVIELSEGDRTEISEKMAEYAKRRREKQPLSLPSAGSTFKRPEGYFAGALIQESGLKGYKSGGAMISDLHAGFVVNYDNATSQDILDVIKHTQETVLDKFGVMLETEVKIIGE